MRVFFFNRNINPPPVSNISTSFKLLFRMALIIDSFMLTGSVAFSCSTPEAFSRAWRPNGRPNTAPQLPGCLLFKPSGKRVGSFFYRMPNWSQEMDTVVFGRATFFSPLPLTAFLPQECWSCFISLERSQMRNAGKRGGGILGPLFSRSHKNAGVLCSRVCSQISDGEIIFGEEITVCE